MMPVATMEVINGRYLLQEEILPSAKAQRFRPQNMESGAKQSCRSDKARVFRTLDIETGDLVALKLLEPWSATSRQMTARFTREVATLQKLSHANIVRLYGSGTTTERRPYYVMELLRGKTLGDRLVEGGPIPVAEFAEYLDQIAAAMDAAHQRGIVHRDINPYNIMLHEDQITGRIVLKLLDFGLAKVGLHESDDSGLTGSGTTLGSPAYMSPEQARGEPLDARSDIYALGVTIYEAITGQLLYSGRTELEVMLSHVNKPFPGLPSGWTGHSNVGGFNEVVRRAVAKSADERPSRATELAEHFRSALERANPELLTTPLTSLPKRIILASLAITILGAIGYWVLHQ